LQTYAYTKLYNLFGGFAPIIFPSVFSNPIRSYSPKSEENRRLEITGILKKLKKYIQSDIVLRHYLKGLGSINNTTLKNLSAKCFITDEEEKGISDSMSRFLHILSMERDSYTIIDKLQEMID
jgi:hypothetical protein